LSQAEAHSNLEASISALVDAQPDLSAQQTMPRRQRLFLVGALAAFLLACVFDATDSIISVLALVTTLYIAITINRAALFYYSSRPSTMLRVSDEEALAYPDEELPSYSVLVPAYREPEVITQLIANLERMVYPSEKLDIKIILEADDSETLAAVRDCDPGDHFEVVVVPPAGPRTKPKALNYAMYAARGDLVTIYDAEDEPEPLQLRRAAIALAQGDSKMACVQAKLSFGNVEQNLITRWFTLEYAMWFSMLLPGLVHIGAPLPLGGTSNHFRRDRLEELGGWDPFNVTEDADLGVRLARQGYHCGVLDSTTLEEANSDFINWVKQRSRWYKGYLQTALIHLRHPGDLRRELGWGGFTQVILFVLGTPVLAVINPLFWFLTLLWFVASPHFIKDLFPAGLYYPSVACWVLGNLLVAYLTILTCRISKRYELIIAALLVPLYWVMMAVAATKALWQLVANPNFWEKTVHGLGHNPVPASDVAAPSVS
jgi:cellulose synthase/poly-beta-1,6-N-acetylglucosamine synthase-like glycosyltransferase